MDKSYKIHRLYLTAIDSLRRTSRNISTNRILCGTHYETLQLSQNCSLKEVRDSFITLSKQCHPDKNQNDPNAHSRFVKLSEAYHILSNPDKRHAYDLILKRESNYNRGYGRTPGRGAKTYGQAENFNHEFSWTYEWKNRHNYDKDDYYGIKGLKRVRNGWIAVLCFIFSSIGVCLQVFLIRKSTAFNRQHLDERSERTGKMLSDVQQQAILRGNQAQLEQLKLRLQNLQTSNHETIQDAQKTYSVNSQNMTNSYSTSEPFVMVVPDIETLEICEKS
ncbi:dnaJ-like protein 60 [Zootermopsis nevadensis]|uniref:DnaJ-like protein 60 n=1 Tax=Zootermopsis nevadensis TaxID=136037 RepID=A0A067RSF7_ZOONE|nr:dnaJ-like protein 60 [Zootermopsis nevadensis]KDR23745.1 DnaJ-like protein 60 [Zootermopsis nevadensis]